MTLVTATPIPCVPIETVHAATPAAETSLDAMFEAAGRGDLAPITQALATNPGAEARTVLEARLAADRYDPAAASDPALARLAVQGSDPALRRAALTVIASVAYANGDYAGTQRASALLERALSENGDSDEAAAAARTRDLAALLVGRPAQRVEGAVVAGSVAAHYDRVGLPRIGVTVNGREQEAVVDTGAHLSVLSRDTARRMGITILEAETRVSNGVEGTVPVRIGVADRLEIAGTVLRDVSFLIIDDEELTFPLPGGYDIRAIIGLPVLRALGRVRIENEGRFSVLPPAGASDAAPNLHASGNDLFVDVGIGGRNVPLYLDTGANQTSLSALYAEAEPARIAGLETGETQRASAGGTRRSQVATWRQAPLVLAGRNLVLPTLPVNLPDDGPPSPYYGQLGSNALRAFESYTIDFATMRLELGEPVAPGSGESN